MVRAMRRLAEDVRRVDAVIEVVDARVPRSGANPALGRITGRKPSLMVLTRADLAEAALTQTWLERLEREGVRAIAIAAKTPGGVARLHEALEGLASARRNRRAIVLGIPNAGKSTVINAIVGKKVARAEDRAGVTRAAQWFRVAPNLELMDTAGILVPKIDTPEAQWKLALVGAVPRARYDPEDLVTRFARWAAAERPAANVPDLETFAQSRGFVRRGNLVDTHNAATAFLKEFGDGRFGPMTLEDPA